MEPGQTRRRFECFITTQYKVNPHKTEVPITAKVVALLQQSSVLTKRFKDLMGRKNRRMEKKEKTKKDTSVECRKSDQESVNARLSKSYTRDSAEFHPVKISVPVHNLNQEADVSYSKSITPDLRSPTKKCIRRQLTVFKNLSIMPPKLTKQASNGRPSHRTPLLFSISALEKSAETVSFGSSKERSPMDVKWLVRPLSSNMKRYVRSKTVFRALKPPVSKSNRE